MSIAAPGRLGVSCLIKHPSLIMNEQNTTWFPAPLRAPAILAAVAASLTLAVALPAADKYWNGNSPAQNSWIGANWSLTPDGPIGETVADTGDSIFITRLNAQISLAALSASPVLDGITVADGISATITTAASGSQTITVSGPSGGDLTWKSISAGYTRLILNATVAWNGKLTEASTATSGTPNSSSGKEIRINAATATGENTKIALNGTGKLVVNQTVASITLGELSGTSATAEITALNQGGGRGIVLNQDTNTTYAGTWTRGSSPRDWSFVKNNAGRIRFTNTIVAWTAGVMINGGSVYLNGEVTGISSSSGTGITVAAGATLGGTGSITLAADKTITLADGAILDPGDVSDLGVASTGILTINGTSGAGLVFAGGATIKFNLDGDKIVLVGDTMTGLQTGVGTITFDFSGSSASVVGTVIDLIDFGGTPGIAKEAFAAGGGWTGEFQYNGNTLQFIAATAPAIPEPATVALVLGLGVGTLVLFRRRR
ncbi:PEP-CTERM putative exosortase interaction domain-containing protein [Opitutaceae bacterium TAV1]|nr:PEP-CTERM putative exosortase interaction domain-containing protein [Opitutaceae bacterium TAV1]